MMGMLALFGALLSCGLSGANSADIPRARSFGGSGKWRRHRVKKLSPAAEKLRKSRKRQENKSRSINARIRRAA